MTQTQSDAANRLVINKFEEDAQAIKYCQEFISPKPGIHYISGRNDCAKSFADLVDVSFLIDDFTEETEYLGKQIVNTKVIPLDTLVVETVMFFVPD